jgi:hypothetical protein
MGIIAATRLKAKTDFFEGPLYFAFFTVHPKQVLCVRFIMASCDPLELQSPSQSPTRPLSGAYEMASLQEGMKELLLVAARDSRFMADLLETPVLEVCQQIDVFISISLESPFPNHVNSAHPRSLAFLW